MHEHEHVAHRAGAVEERGVGAVELGEDRGGLVADLGQHELGDRALGPGLAAGDGAVGAAQVEQAHRLVVGDVAADAGGAAGEALGVGVERGDQRRRRAAPCRPGRRRCSRSRCRAWRGRRSSRRRPGRRRRRRGRTRR